MTKKILYEVNIIRPIVITLLVLLHAFAIFYGGWDKPYGVKDIKIYEYLSCIIRGFRIETIAFIAGYVFSYQVTDLGRVYTLRGIAKKKFLRLVVPCWIFGIVYALCFSRSEPILDNIVAILNGIGHLWFLTMLFWCFITLFIINKYTSGKGNIILLLCLLVASLIPIPNKIPLFGLGKMPHFLFYAYLGYVFYIYREKIYATLRNKYLILLLLYGIFVILSFYVLPGMHNNEEMPIFVRLASYGSLKISQCMSAMTGITFLYIIVQRFLKKKGDKYVLPDFVNRANKMCYGVYVFHQFILMYLYYYTNLPSMISPYILPVLSFIVVMALSVFLTAIFTKFRFGRFLIG